MAEQHEVDAWLAALLSQLEPAAQKKMLREVARDVRRIQQANITAQRSPDGTAWEPRRFSALSKKGRIRRGMFAKLKTAEYLKVSVNKEQAQIGFAKEVFQITRVHHYGLREKMRGRANVVKYSERRLLGFNLELVDHIRDLMLHYISPSK